MSSVSFVITVYNKEDYVGDTLRSVLDQVGDFESEIVVVDDASTDRSPEIIEKLIGDLPNASIVTFRDNVGPAFALNAGIAAASKAFIKPVDGDDVLTRDSADRLLKCFTDPDVAFVRGASIRFSGPTDELSAGRDPEPAMTVFSAPLESAIRNSLSGCTEVMFRRDPFLACGGCDETVFMLDQSYIWRLATQHRFAFTDEVIAIRPAHQSETLIENRNQIEHDRNAALCGLIRDYPSLPEKINRLAFRRCAGRAWKWAHRENRKPWGSDTTFWISLMSYLPWVPGRLAMMFACLSPYRAGGRVRIPGAAPTRPG